MTCTNTCVTEKKRVIESINSLIPLLIFSQCLHGKSLLLEHLQTALLSGTKHGYCRCPCLLLEIFIIVNTTSLVDIEVTSKLVQFAYFELEILLGKWLIVYVSCCCVTTLCFYSVERQTILLVKRRTANININVTLYHILNQKLNKSNLN